MKVMVIVKASKASEAGEMPSEKLLAEMGAFNEQLANAGIMLAGEGLHPSSRGHRVTFDGAKRTVTDGPFAETKELIAGFWIWKVNSMQEALDWVKRCPNPHEEICDVEIRQVFAAEDFGESFTPELREQEARLRAKSLGLGEMRFANSDAMTFAGTSKRYTKETMPEICKQWGEFAPQMTHVPGRIGGASFGVCHNGNDDCSFDYLCAVQIAAGSKPGSDWHTLQVPARRYAVFTIDGPVSELPKTFETIWTQWVPDCGLKVAKAPCVEVYPKNFKPEDQKSGIEIRIPLEA